MPNPFSQKELEALDLQWRSNEIEKIDAERDYHDGLLNRINTRLQQRLNVTLMPRLATKTWREFTRAGWQQRTHRESFRRARKT